MFVWQKSRYELYGQGLKRETVFDDGHLADKVAATEIFRNMDKLFENFIFIEFKLWIFLEIFIQILPDVSK